MTSGDQPDRLKGPLVLAGLCGLILAASAVAQNGHLAGSASGAAATSGAVNTGKPAEGAFHVDFQNGHDEDTQYLGDYVMNLDHNGTVYDPAMIDFSGQQMMLNLKKKATRGVPFIGSEFHQSGFYGYGRYEVVMKGAKGSGVVSSFFTHTYDGFGDPHDEIDIEFLGKNTRAVELNYFKDGESWGGKVIKLDFDYSEEFHLYAFEWSPQSIRWFLDDKMLFEVKASETNLPLPTASGRVIANIWAGRGSTQDWTGKATTQKASAAYLCMSHVPLGQAGHQCSDDR